MDRGEVAWAIDAPQSPVGEDEQCLGVAAFRFPLDKRDAVAWLARRGKPLDFVHDAHRDTITIACAI